MAPRVVYYAAASLDGRIAGPDHDVSFLETLAGEGGSYEEFFAGVDSLVMGAGTWRFVVRHGSWPSYGDKPSWVVTHARELEPLAGADGVAPFAGDVRELVELIGARGLSRTWLVGGGDLAAQFLAADLLDELEVAIAPTFVGEGPALADGEFPLRRFRLLEVGRLATDGVVLRYERAR